MWEFLLDELHLSQLLCSCSSAHFPVHQLSSSRKDKTSQVMCSIRSGVTAAGPREGEKVDRRGDRRGHTTE